MSVLIVMAAIKKMQKPKRIVSLLNRIIIKIKKRFKNTIFQGTFQNPLYDRGKNSELKIYTDIVVVMLLDYQTCNFKEQYQYLQSI